MNNEFAIELIKKYPWKPLMNYMAVDKDGKVSQYEYEPVISKIAWDMAGPPDQLFAIEVGTIDLPTGLNWEDTLIKKDKSTDVKVYGEKSIVHPNKIFIVQGDIEKTVWDESRKYTYFIVIAADSIETAQEYLKTEGIELHPTWLMGASYQTIWTQDGTRPEEIQAKILYKTHTVC